jgi:hypothetical protein
MSKTFRFLVFYVSSSQNPTSISISTQKEGEIQSIRGCCVSEDTRIALSIQFRGYADRSRRHACGRWDDGIVYTQLSVTMMMMIMMMICFQPDSRGTDSSANLLYYGVSMSVLLIHGSSRMQAPR